MAKNTPLDMNKLEHLTYSGDIPPYSEYEKLEFEPKDAEQSIQRLLYLIGLHESDERVYDVQQFGLNHTPKDIEIFNMDTRLMLDKLGFLLKKSGSPNIKIEKPGTESEEGFGSDRAYYQPWSNTIGVFMDDLLDDAIAEIPHAISDESVSGKPFRSLLQFIDDKTDFMKAGYIGKAKTNENYEKLYDRLGTEEYVAHQVLEPMIDKYINFTGYEKFSEKSAEEFYGTLLNAIKEHRYTKKPVE